MDTIKEIEELKEVIKKLEIELKKTKEELENVQENYNCACSYVIDKYGFAAYEKMLEYY